MSNTTIEIAKDGDLILIVGPQQLRILAKSTNLKAASKPFSAMLSPCWKEGRDLLKQDIPMELSLPGDKAEAFKHLCAIIHDRSDLVSETLDAGVILDIAIMADKYDFAGVFNLACKPWPRFRASEDLMLLTAAAYLFGNAYAFKVFTRALVLNHSGPYLDLFCDEVESAMDWKVFCLLEQQRDSLRLRLAGILLPGNTNQEGRCIRKCSWAVEWTCAYLNVLEEQRLFPMDMVCLFQAIRRAETMPDAVPRNRSTNCGYGTRHSPKDFKRTLYKPLNTLKRSAGLCLLCIQSYETSPCCYVKEHDAECTPDNSHQYSHVLV